MRTIAFSIAAAAAMLCLARDTNRHDRVVADASGMTWSQRGGLGTSNFVATAFSPAALFDGLRTNAVPSASRSFSNAVASVVSPYSPGPSPSGGPVVIVDSVTGVAWTNVVSGGRFFLVSGGGAR